MGVKNRNGEALRTLRDWLGKANLADGGRLPPERDLCRDLGISRGALRGALATMEAEGRVWRHVGRGTFLGRRPPAQDRNIALLARRTHPEEVMEARLVIEPQIAALAAKRATLDDVQEIARCLAKARAAKDLATFELWDSAFHRALACAARNTLLLGLFDAVNSVRERRIWGKLKVAAASPQRIARYNEQHELCFAAVRDRFPDEAERIMRAHLEIVRANMFRGESSAATTSAVSEVEPV